MSAGMKLLGVGSMDLMVFGRRVSPFITRSFVIPWCSVRGKLSDGHVISRALWNSKVKYRVHKRRHWLLF